MLHNEMEKDLLVLDIWNIAKNSCINVVFFLFEISLFLDDVTMYVKHIKGIRHYIYVRVCDVEVWIQILGRKFRWLTASRQSGRDSTFYAFQSPHILRDGFPFFPAPSVHCCTMHLTSGVCLVGLGCASLCSVWMRFACQRTLRP